MQIVRFRPGHGTAQEQATHIVTVHNCICSNSRCERNVFVIEEVQGAEDELKSRVKEACKMLKRAMNFAHL